MGKSADAASAHAGRADAKEKATFSTIISQPQKLLQRSTPSVGRKKKAQQIGCWLFSKIILVLCIVQRAWGHIALIGLDLYSSRDIFLGAFLSGVYVTPRAVLVYF